MVTWSHGAPPHPPFPLPAPSQDEWPVYECVYVCGTLGGVKDVKTATKEEEVKKNLSITLCRRHS